MKKLFEGPLVGPIVKVENAPETAPEPSGDTSERAKSFKKHCLRCRKYHNHRHTPATYNTRCTLCPCTYYYGWESWSKKFKVPLSETRKNKKPDTLPL